MTPLWYRKGKKKRQAERLNLVLKAEEIAKPGNELRFPQSGISALTTQSCFLAVILSF